MKQKKILSWKQAVTGLTLGLLMMLCCTASSRAADIYVDDDTCPDVGTGTNADPYCSIQYAITQAVSEDDVLVNPGDYAAIIMKTGVNVLKAQTEKPRIIATGMPGPLVDFQEGVQFCTLDGFVLDDSDRSLYGTVGYAIIRMTGYYNKYDWDPDNNTDLTVSNCDIQGADTLDAALARAGITLHGTLFNTRIANNTIRNIQGRALVNGKDGLPSKYCTLTIEGNTIEENLSGGIVLKSEAKFWNIVSIKNNTITRNNQILHSSGTAGIRLTNIHGGTLDGGVTFRKENCGASVEGNDISYHDLAGLLLEKTQSVAPHIVNNTFHHNSLAGINIMGWSPVTISNNEIYNNGRAGIAFNSNYLIHAGPSSSPVRIEDNNIHDNAFAGIGTIDYITGPVTITGNNLQNNTMAGIALFNAADEIVIENNDIHDNDTAGIYTGKWTGLPAQQHTAGPDVKFDRTNGPVHLTIKKNKIYRNLAGMRIDHASGTISNNLIYANDQAGIRYSGNNVGDFAPFGESWGITSIKNNTVSDNGKAGIVYDNINYIPDDGFERDFTDVPRMSRQDGLEPIPIPMMNNITTWNVTLGLRDSTCDTTIRDFNLLYYNMYNQNPHFERFQFGSCLHNPYEIGEWTYPGNPTDADPLFVDRANEDYHLQTGPPQSPAIATGQDGTEMGAYGGSDPLTL